MYAIQNAVPAKRLRNGWMRVAQNIRCVILRRTIQLQRWEKSGLPLKRFFNTSGNIYKEMKLKDKLPEMSEEEQLALLATDGMLVKRPILVGKDKVLVGAKEKEWEEKLL